MARRGERQYLLPLTRRWSEPENPLPVRRIHAAKQRSTLAWHEMPAQGPIDSREVEPLNFGVAMQGLIMDIATRCPEFRHVQAPRILVTAIQARGNHAHGLQARVTPLRFAHGALTRKRRGVLFQIQRYFLGDHEFLYLLTFCLPRFLDQDFDGKFITIFHELFHMSPAFDGDLRRHQGRYHVHTHSQREYDKQMAHFAREYLAQRPDPSLFAFLRLNFAQLQQRHGEIVSMVVPKPVMIPLVGPYAPMASAPEDAR